jgi:hypothetical protein
MCTGHLVRKRLTYLLVGCDHLRIDWMQPPTNGLDTIYYSWVGCNHLPMGWVQSPTYGLGAITYLWVGCNHLPMGWVQSPTYGLGATCNLWIPRNHGRERTHMCVKISNLQHYLWVKYNQISQGCKQPSVSPLHGSYRLMLAPTSGSIVTLFTLARLRLLLRQQKPILYGSILYFPGCIIFTDSSHRRTRKHQIYKM